MVEAGLSCNIRATSPMSVFRPIGCDECCQLDWDGVPAPPC